MLLAFRGVRCRRSQLAGFSAFCWSWWVFVIYTILISRSLPFFSTSRDSQCILDVYVREGSSLEGTKIVETATPPLAPNFGAQTQHPPQQTKWKFPTVPFSACNYQRYLTTAEHPAPSPPNSPPQTERIPSHSYFPTPAEVWTTFQQPTRGTATASTCNTIDLEMWQFIV